MVEEKTVAAKAAKTVAKAAKKKRSRYDVSPEDFVVAWQTSDNAAEVAAKLKMTKASVLSRASNYRKRGVGLKQMEQAKARVLDVEKLNRLAGTGINTVACGDDEEVVDVPCVDGAEVA